MLVFSCVRRFATSRTVARQAPLCLGCSRQESWIGLPRPPPGDLPYQGSNLRLLLWRVGSGPLAPPEKLLHQAQRSESIFSSFLLSSPGPAPRLWRNSHHLVMLTCPPPAITAALSLDLTSESRVKSSPFFFLISNKKYICLLKLILLMYLLRFKIFTLPTWVFSNVTCLFLAALDLRCMLAFL